MAHSRPLDLLAGALCAISHKLHKVDESEASSMSRVRLSLTDLGLCRVIGIYPNDNGRVSAVDVLCLETTYRRSTHQLVFFFENNQPAPPPLQYVQTEQAIWNTELEDPD